MQPGDINSIITAVEKTFQVTGKNGYKERVSEEA